MGFNFPTSPASNEPYPKSPTAIAYSYKSASSVWANVRGRADRTNRFTNGALQVSQVNWDTNGVNVQGLWMADEWYVYYDSSSVSWRGQLIFDVITPGGSDRRARITIETAAPTLIPANWLVLEQGIEATRMYDLQWGTANAKQLVLRFGFKGPAGTYGLSIRNAPITHSYVTSWTITSAQANTETVQTFVIPGCTVGTWRSNINAWGWFDFTMANGEGTTTLDQWQSGNHQSPSTITNGMATVGNVFEFFDFGLYADPNRTGLPPEFEMPEYTSEMRRCQRYIARVYGIRGIITDFNRAERAGTTLPVPMRTVPSLSWQGAPRFWDGSATGYVIAIPNNYSSRNFVNCGVQVTLDAGAFTVGRPACNYYSSYWDAIIADACF